jgi:TfdA family taurine catabolism dioxygenase TauD
MNRRYEVRENGMPDIDAAMLAAEVRERLPREGYVHIDRALPEEIFTAAARELGTVTMRTDIRVDAAADDALRRARDPLHADRPSVYRAESLSYHTDTPLADVLAWYCVEQDSADGSSALVDTGDVARHFSAEELAMMERVRVRSMVRDAGHEIVREYPLLAAGKVYYASWLVAPDLGEAERKLAARFDEYLAKKDATAPIRIRLKPGEMLFVDNHRVLHGRSELPPDSRRHLVRLYIRTEQR